MGIIIFWSVLAALYAALAFVTWLASKPVKRELALHVKYAGIVNEDEKGKQVALESTLQKAFKGIIITDIVGFSLACIAAILSIILN